MGASKGLPGTNRSPEQANSRLVLLSPPKLFGRENERSFGLLQAQRMLVGASERPPDHAMYPLMPETSQIVRWSERTILGVGGGTRQHPELPSKRLNRAKNAQPSLEGCPKEQKQPNRWLGDPPQTSNDKQSQD